MHSFEDMSSFNEKTAQPVSYGELHAISCVILLSMLGFSSTTIGTTRWWLLCGPRER